MTNYYIKLQDTYLQVCDRDQPFFSGDRVGKLYTVSSEDRARQMLSVLFSGIPFNMFTLELVVTKTMYYRYARVGADYVVYCDDHRWHNERDLKHITPKPIEYDSPDKAEQASNIDNVTVFSYTVL